MSLFNSLFFLSTSLLFFPVFSPHSPFLLLLITSGLQTDEGLHLMEILARLAKIQMTDFAELSYVFLLFFAVYSFTAAGCSLFSRSVYTVGCHSISSLDWKLPSSLKLVICFSRFKTSICPPEWWNLYRHTAVSVASLNNLSLCQ